MPLFRSRAERKVTDAGYDPARLPPGQYLTEKWPVLHAGSVPSTDLATWNRVDQPVLSVTEVPWAWQDTLTARNGFRDPFVMPDPSTPNRWLMYYSTFPAAAQGACE